MRTNPRLVDLSCFCYSTEVFASASLPTVFLHLQVLFLLGLDATLMPGDCRFFKLAEQFALWKVLATRSHWFEMTSTTRLQLCTALLQKTIITKKRNAELWPKIRLVH